MYIITEHFIYYKIKFIKFQHKKWIAYAVIDRHKLSIIRQPEIYYG